MLKPLLCYECEYRIRRASWLNVPSYTGLHLLDTSVAKEIPNHYDQDPGYHKSNQTHTYLLSLGMKRPNV